MNRISKYLVIKKHELKLITPKKVWQFLYLVSMQKFLDRRIYSEKKKLRKNSTMVYYIIRRRPPGAGLFSNVFHVIQGIINAQDLSVKIDGNRFGRTKVEPIVDFKNYYMSQLHRQSEFPVSTNSWELYFEQLTPVNLDIIYREHSYIVCDEKFKGSQTFMIQKAPLWFFSQEKLKLVSQIINTYIRPSKKLEDVISQWKMSIEWDPHTTLAVGVRGGIYEKYQYAGHARQASVEEIVPEIELFLQKYNISKIYPQTHDYANYEILKKRYGKMVQKSFAMDKFKNYSEFITQGPIDRPYHWDRVPKLSFADN